MQVAYQPMHQISAGAGQPFFSAAKQNLFRLEVINVPQYLNTDEFRAQFLKIEGCVDAVVEKDDARYMLTSFHKRDQARQAADHSGSIHAGNTRHTS